MNSWYHQFNVYLYKMLFLISAIAFPLVTMIIFETIQFSLVKMRILDIKNLIVDIKN